MKKTINIEVSVTIPEPEEILKYLERKNWLFVSASNNCTFFNKNQVEIMVLTNTNFADYSRRFEELIRDIAIAEETTTGQILSEMNLIDFSR